MKYRSVRTSCASILFFAAGIPLCAHAHHAMDSATPANLFEGLVSGLAHPVIGLDHLLFVIAIGVACYYFGRLVASTFAFLIGALAGTALHLHEAGIPYAEAGVALTLVALGVLLLVRSDLLKSKSAIAIFALAGVAHGYAYGEAIVGAETTPLVAYLAGFTIVQLAIAVSAYAFTRYVDRTRPSMAMLKVAGSGLAASGAAFLLFSFAA